MPVQSDDERSAVEVDAVDDGLRTGRVRRARRRHVDRSIARRHRPDPCVDPQLTGPGRGGHPRPLLLPRTGSASPAHRSAVAVDAPAPPARRRRPPRPSWRSGSRRGRPPPTRTHRSTTTPVGHLGHPDDPGREPGLSATPAAAASAERSTERHTRDRPPSPVSSVGMSSPSHSSSAASACDLRATSVGGQAEEDSRRRPQVEPVRQRRSGSTRRRQVASSARSASATKRGRSTSYQCRSQPAANGVPTNAAVTVVVQGQPGVQLRERAGPGAEGSMPATPGEPGDRQIQDVETSPGSSRPAPGEHSQSSPASSCNRRARSRVNALLASVRSPAIAGGDRPRRAGLGVRVGLCAASHGSGSPVCSSTPVARSEPLAAQRPGEVGDGVGQAAGRSRAPGRRTGRRQRRSPRRTASYDVAEGAMERNRGSSGRSAAAAPTGLSTTSSSGWVCPRTDARQSSTRSPSSKTTTTATRPISAPLSPTRLPTTPSTRARSGPGTAPETARPISRRRDRDGMPGIVTTAVRHPGAQSWASSRSRSSPRRRTSNFQFARNASIDSGFSGRWSGGDQK